MPRSPRELGLRQPYTVKVGVDGLQSLGGVDKESDPAAVLDYKFTHLENTRLGLDGIVVERGGEAKTHNSPIPALDGFFDTSDIGAASTT